MNQEDRQTALEMLPDQIADLKRRIDGGERGLLDHLERLVNLKASLQADIDAEEDPILAELTVKTRKYTLTPEALAARRQNAQKSTGPTSDEGKATSARNSWKHGSHARSRVLGFGKPCKSTCPKYPCSLVDDGDVQPGQDCLDKEFFALTLNAISKALAAGELTELKEIVTLQLGGTLQVIEELQSSILQYGVYMKHQKLNKEGAVIGYELKANPSLLPLANLLKAAGVTLPDFMITPAAIERKKSDDDAREGIADLFRTAADGLALAREKKGE